MKGPGFPAAGDPRKLIDDARELASASGFEIAKYKVCESLRKQVSTGEKKKTPALDTMFAAAGATVPKTGVVGDDVAKRVAALETLRHLWLLKKMGSHKLWILSLPDAYRDWAAADLAGKDVAAIGTRVNDRTSHFSADDRKHLSQATQNGLRWVNKALAVAGAPDNKKNMAIIRRWFADANSTDETMKAAAGTLNNGLKLIAAAIKSTFLLIADMPIDRGVAARASTNAFVFSDEKVEIIYVEPAFFSDGDYWKDLKNWTRIVVHELSHRKAKTKDHRYRHNRNGLKPDATDAKFTAAEALANADSWAMFCMDCAGAMIDADYVKVKVTK